MLLEDVLIRFPFRYEQQSHIPLLEMYSFLGDLSLCQASVTGLVGKQLGGILCAEWKQMRTEIILTMRPAGPCSSVL